MKKPKTQPLGIAVAIQKPPSESEKLPMADAPQESPIERAKQLGWDANDPEQQYSAEEVLALDEKIWSLTEDHVFNYNKPGGAIWQRKWGKVADLPFAPVLRMVEDAFKEPQTLSQSGLHDLLETIGAHMALAVDDNDADYFRRLATVLDARSAGRDLRKLTAKELLLELGPGRQPTPLDLSRVFPLVLIKAASRRLKGCQLGEYTKARITRDELIKAVFERGATISEGELTRQLGEHDFRSFIAEQPIAQKPPKSAG